MKEFVRSRLKDSLHTFERLLADESMQATLAEVAELMAGTLKNRGKLILAGNGGSAADAQHMAAEFVGRLNVDRPALHAIALAANSSTLTALANDHGYDCVFERQIEAIGQAGDLFLGISTSGNSRNVLRALEQCKKQGIATVGLTGGNGGAMKALCDRLIVAPSEVTQNIQECHLAMEHILCGLVERICFGPEFFERG